MSASAAKGAILALKITSTYTTIPGLGDFNYQLPEPEIADVTAHDSPANHDEKIPTILKGQSLSAPITKWDDSNACHTALLAANGTVASFQYTGAGYNAGIKFNAIVMLQMSNPVKGAKSATLKLEVSDGNTPT
jgi:hypothetical protein